jgi:hypothetical protein
MAETRRMADVNLAEDTFHREFLDAIPLAESIGGLPQMQGSGLARSLHEAASQSAELKELLTRFSHADERQAQYALLDQILAAWADTSGIRNCHYWN